MINPFLSVLMRNLNCTEIDSLAKRIMLQKKIYLIQRMGFNLGYSFIWYHYGPYCVSLNLDSFNIDPNFRSPQLTEDQEKILVNFLKFSEGNENNVRFFETAASLAFIRSENPQLNPAQLLERLLSLKSHITKAEGETALINLQKFGII